MRTFIILLLLVSLPLCSQEASVVQLTEKFSEEARNIDIEQRKLDERKAYLKYEIVKEFLEAPQTQNSGCVVNGMLVKPDWGCGEFTFSKDFKYIVPAKVLTPSPYGAQLFTIVKGITVKLDQNQNQDEE
jgi:hypothetical protein